MTTPDLNRDGVPSYDDVVAAAAVLAGVARVTPVLCDDLLDELVAAEVSVKAEFLQRGGSFKFRGIYNKLSSLTPDALSRGVVIASSGNAGLATALAARAHGSSSVVVMPEHPSAVKRQAIEAAGGRVIAHGRSSDEMLRYAEETAARDGRSYIHPFDQAEVIAGQGTIGLELDRQLPECDVVLVPAGGGGMLSGVALALRRLRPALTIIGVEPEGANSIQRSLASGHVTPVDGATSTVAEGLAVRSCGTLALALIQQNVDEMLAVSDETIMQAVGILWNTLHVAVEPSGAAALAALLSNERFRNQRVALIASGANIEPRRLEAGITAASARR